MYYDEYEFHSDIEEELNRFFWFLAEGGEAPGHLVNRAKKIWQDFKGLGYALEKHYEQQKAARIPINAEQVAKNIEGLKNKVAEKRQKNKNKKANKNEN